MSSARLRPPLLATGLTLALLLLGPGWWLWHSPRRHASGLERLAASAALLQSFRSEGGLQAPPSLWRKRLGPRLADQLWARRSGFWWQFWGGHGDGAEFLVLSAEAFRGGKPLPLPPQALEVDDLVVLAADPLNRQWLQEQLHLKFAPPQGLQLHCLNQLRSSETVYWSGPTLGELLGPLTPLFLPFQQGCFALSSQGQALIWQGEATPLGATPKRTATAVQPNELVAPGDPQALLLLQGGRLAPLVDGLLGSRLVSESLQKHYGLGPAQLGLLRQAPFRLRLRPQPQGPYQASLELQLAINANPSDWQALLSGLRKGLLAQGLEEQEAARPQWQRLGMAERFSASTWQRGGGKIAEGTASASMAADGTVADGTAADAKVVGGWRWLYRRPESAKVQKSSLQNSSLQNSQGQPEGLLLFLGPPPHPASATAASFAPGEPIQVQSDQLSLWAQPQALARLGLWPPGLPSLLKRSRSLQIGARALDAAGWSSGSSASRLTGRLELN